MFLRYATSTNNYNSQTVTRTPTILLMIGIFEICDIKSDDSSGNCVSQASKARSTDNYEDGQGTVLWIPLGGSVDTEHDTRCCCVVACHVVRVPDPEERIGFCHQHAQDIAGSFVTFTRSFCYTFLVSSQHLFQGVRKGFRPHTMFRKVESLTLYGLQLPFIRRL